MLRSKNSCQHLSRDTYRAMLVAFLLVWSIAITNAQSASDGLEPQNRIERTIASGETHVFTIQLLPDWYTQIVVEQQGVDVVVTVYDPAGQCVTQMDRPNGAFGPEAVSIVAETAGRYLIKISALQKFAARAPYTITLTDRRLALPNDLIRVKAERLISEGERLRVSEITNSLTQAVERFSQAVTIWRTLGEPYEEAVAIYGRGWSYQAMGDYQEAIYDFRAATQQMGQLRNQHGGAITQSALAWAYLYAGEYEQARQSLQSALDLFKTLQNPRAEAVTLSGLGWLCALTGEPTQALNYFQGSLRLRQLTEDRRGEVLTLTAIGLVYNHLAQPTNALVALQRALELARTLESLQIQANPLSKMGVVYLSLQNYERARGYLEEALHIYRQTGDRSSEADVLYSLARVEVGQSHLQQACSRIEASLEIIESLRNTGNDWQLRTSYMAVAQDHYHLYVDILMRMHEREPLKGHAAAALYTTERARARTLLDQLQKFRAQSISARYTKLTQSRPLTAEQIQRELLDNNTLLLEYALGEERSYVWAITPTSLASYELPKRAEIEAQAERVYGLLNERNKVIKGEMPRQQMQRVARADAELPAQAASLSQMILGPLAAELGKKRLLVVTQGKLQFIPFAALPEPGGTNHPQSWTPMMANHEIVHLPSASTLAVLRQETAHRQAAPKKLAVVADPVFELEDTRFKYAREQAKLATAPPIPANLPHELLRAAGVFGESGDQFRFRRLENTGREADRVTRLVPAAQVFKATGFSANRAMAVSGKLSNYRIVHFASHSFLHSEHPDLSGIVLSLFDERRHKQDGFLRLYDIYKLKLSADLVVLSACRTGLGKEVKGEGLMSFARGFMYAGAPRVVVSAWSIEDRASATLMVKFYNHLLGPEKLSAAAALRAAQLEMWRDSEFAAPYFWAGFELQGEWK